MRTEDQKRRAREAALRWRNKNLTTAREGYRSYREKWKLNDPEGYRKIRRAQALKRMSLTPEEFYALRVAQDDCCAICRRRFSDDLKPHIDHNHGCCPQNESCGKCIRGLLCPHCNMGLGRFYDDPLRLAAAIEYLRR